MSTHKLEQKYIISGKIELKTGLMIGGSSNMLEIGGTDKQIVRHPVTKIPYIPGSSLKGKMRSLFELSRGEISKDQNDSGYSFGPTHDPAHLSAQIFGHIKARQNKNESQRPSRLIVRDAMMSEESIELLKNTRTDVPFSEVKAENSINRITAEANPRFFERVPQKTTFKFEMVLNVFDKEVDTLRDEYLNGVYDAMRLLEDDYLGGGGSRGNGHIKFKEVVVKKKTYSPRNETAVNTPEDFK